MAGACVFVRLSMHMCEDRFLNGLAILFYFVKVLGWSRKQLKTLAAYIQQTFEPQGLRCFKAA